jgi:hypothetical protein
MAFSGLDGILEKNLVRRPGRAVIAFLGKTALNLYCKQYKTLIIRGLRAKFCVLTQIG